jgi:hypothetical protein
MMTDYVMQKQKRDRCTMIVLDAFTGNFNAHRFFTTKDLFLKDFTFEDLK